MFRRKPAKSLMSGHIIDKKNDLKDRYKRDRSIRKETIQFREVTKKDVQKPSNKKSLRLVKSPIRNAAD